MKIFNLIIATVFSVLICEIFNLSIFQAVLVGALSGAIIPDLLCILQYHAGKS